MAWGREGNSHPSVTLPIAIPHKRSRGHRRFSRRGGCRGWWEEERASARGLGWMDNLEWNCWNRVLIRSDMKGIFRFVWIVWFDTYQGWIEGLYTRIWNTNDSTHYIYIFRQIIPSSGDTSDSQLFYLWYLTEWILDFYYQNVSPTSLLRFIYQ
jgi:hypothetical protein